MEALQIKNLTFKYPQNPQNSKAVDNVTFSVKKGEFVLLCGESGCGKSTLLRLLKRELSPYGEKSGEIFYNGQPLSELDNRSSAVKIGFVLQNPDSQIVTDSVWHELAFGLENLGLDTQTIRRRVAENASYFGIEDWFHKKTDELSGGQKQLLNLASVMAMQPELLLLDEPTAQLGPIAASNFISVLQKLNRESGITILLAEHRLEEIFPIADRVLLMDKGRLAFFDRPKEITNFFKENPEHPMLDGLPGAMKIFRLSGGEGSCPITVREGRDYIREAFKNEVDRLEIPPYSHSEEKAVELKEVWFRYGRDFPDVIKGASFCVYKGEHFCIVGSNGTGKSTALNVIAGILKAYRGKILIDGKKVSDYSGNSLYINNIALLPQNPQTVFLEKTVREDLTETCRVMNLKADGAEQEISEITQKLEITHILESHPYDLSGGEQQKAALAKILLLKPRILLLDEPTKGIDPYSKQALSRLLIQLKKEGMTIITVTHDVEFAAQNADRCGMFFDGELVSQGTPTEFFSENSFYTTCANRISRGFFKNTVLCSQVAQLCLTNGRKDAINE